MRIFSVNSPQKLMVLDSAIMRDALASVLIVICLFQGTFWFLHHENVSALPANY